MNNISKALLILGVFFILLGLLWQFGSKFLPLGRLPGDIVIEKPNYSFYFPIATSILLSVVFSLVLYLIRLFNKGS